MTTFPGISPVIKNYNRAENAFFSRIVTVPLSQEKNVVCKPLVFEGQTVEEGQIIAESEDSLKAKIHSPVPGKVIDFISVKNPDGRPVVAVRIKFEGSFSYTGKQRIETNWKELAPSSIQKTLSEMGIINTYHVMEVVSLSQQVNKARQTKIKNVAVRLFDEDPVRITDTLISKLYSEEILVGARIIAKAIDAEQIIYFFGNKKS
ncbi:MAG: hypothetical protein HUK25_10220, partial [Treponema sp.]|nr:hypothetical protein [Clostridia bacterium]MCF0243004.1 hypothetical protein [Treponema sp.]